VTINTKGRQSVAGRGERIRRRFSMLTWSKGIGKIQTNTAGQRESLQVRKRTSRIEKCPAALIESTERFKGQENNGYGATMGEGSKQSESRGMLRKKRSSCQ